MERERSDRAERGELRRYYRRIYSLKERHPRSKHTRLAVRRDRHWWVRDIAPRRRRLCARSGHVWGLWHSYVNISAVYGTGVTSTESGEQRNCWRCKEQQFRNLSLNGSDRV